MGNGTRISATASPPPRPPKLTLGTALNLLTKPRWCWSMLGMKRRTFRNIVGHVGGVRDTRSISAWAADQFDQRLDWDDVRRIRDRWQGRLILKGILDAEDAEKAATTGAEALIVSNHGGRQLDGAPSTIAALPEIADAVGSRIEVLMDGGIRSGQDVLKAVALGAKASLSAAPSCTGSAPMVRPESPSRWRSSARNSTPRWLCAAA